ncbi:MAG: aminotransferase class III-fold pyridoxal phosphate-dependent enzyme, partial [Nannocystaceae bacterium]
IVGGGLPVGAYGGRRDIMQCVAPLGPVYQAGTLSGNPLGVAAGLATLEILERTQPYEQLAAQTNKLVSGLAKLAVRHRVPMSENHVASMFTGFFRNRSVRNYADARGCDLEHFALYHREMLSRGVYLAPSQFEAGFVSVAHDDATIDRTLAAADGALAVVAQAIQQGARPR